MATQKPLIVIVGPTASGKTGVAIRLAKEFNGEIISADSRAIYKHMDIGTAKATVDEQCGIKHWGIDLVEPDESFTVADFQKYTNEIIDDIYRRGKLPIIVGGSGLYVDSVIFNYQFVDSHDEKLRAKLNKMTVEELIKYCEKHNITLPENYKNKRYLVRAIERKGNVSNNRKAIRNNCIVVGITTNKEELTERIKQRSDKMFDSDIESETKYLADRYSFDLESMKSNIYPIVWKMMNGEISRDEAKQLFITDDWHLAKKQITWFKRNPYIIWLPLKEIEQKISELLS